MKKMNFKMVLMLTMAIGAATFISCSSDDGEDSSSNNEQTSKYVAKITCDYGDGVETTSFNYDSQGRVVKKTETETYGRQESSATTTYTYGNNTIISKIQGDWNNGEIHTFTLSDGRIIKDVEESRGHNSYTYNYTYDSNGYLKTQVFTDDSDYPNSGRIDFTWTDGNLTKVSKIWDDGESYSMTISYSSIPWPKNWIHYWKGTNMDEVFEPLGAWGKMPKNLPLKCVQVGDDGSTEELTIDYTIENGEITKIIFQGDMYDKTEINTIEWR